MILGGYIKENNSVCTMFANRNKLHENLSEATRHCQQYDACMGVYRRYTGEFEICRKIVTHPRLKNYDVYRKQESFGKLKSSPNLSLLERL